MKEKKAWEKEDQERPGGLGSWREEMAPVHIFRSGK